MASLTQILELSSTVGQDQGDVSSMCQSLGQPYQVADCQDALDQLSEGAVQLQQAIQGFADDDNLPTEPFDANTLTWMQWLDDLQQADASLQEGVTGELSDLDDLSLYGAVHTSALIISDPVYSQDSEISRYAQYFQQVNPLP